jgi:trans-o-hydroxybenzylidenepyruvate hydratase-aldolase
MARRTRLTAAEITGAWAMLPTPATADASDYRVADTVDVVETARMVEGLIAAGIDGFLSLGTFGEGATLTWDEKRIYMATLVEAAAGRIPVFGGTTALNTREAIAQTRAAHDLGVDGVVLGVPMWCKADLATAVQFYRDVAEACPDVAICVYANPQAFKFEFTTPFWAAVASIPQVVTVKYLGIGPLAADLRVTAGRIRFLPIAEDYYAAARLDPEAMTAFWTGSAVCGPAPVIALRDAVVAAVQNGDWTRAKTLSEAINDAAKGLFPNGDFAEFSKYNIGLEKARMNAAGWVNAGPCRPPYHLVPEAYLEGARRSGRAWADLHRACLAPA